MPLPPFSNDCIHLSYCDTSVTWDRKIWYNDKFQYASISEAKKTLISDDIPDCKQRTYTASTMANYKNPADGTTYLTKVTVDNEEIWVPRDKV